MVAGGEAVAAVVQERRVGPTARIGRRVLFLGGGGEENGRWGGGGGEEGLDEGLGHAECR